VSFDDVPEIIEVELLEAHEVDTPQVAASESPSDAGAHDDDDDDYDECSPPELRRLLAAVEMKRMRRSLAPHRVSVSVSMSIEGSCLWQRRQSAR
jgi:hypothetical protein